MPLSTHVAGIYLAEQHITLKSLTADVNIYYTTDGSDPTPDSTLYTGPIPVDRTMTIKSIAVKGDSVSGIATATYTIDRESPTVVRTGNSVCLTNKSSETVPVQLFLATYNPNNRMCEIYAKQGTLAAGGTLEMELPAAIDEEIKVFLLDPITHRPLCGVRDME